MPVELKVPQAGESINEVQIAAWRKAEGDHVERDEIVAELETDKAALDLPSPASGRLGKLLKRAGESVSVGEVIAYIEESAEAPAKQLPARPRADDDGARKTEAKPEAEHAVEESPSEARVMPAARRALAEHDLRPADVKATGPGGRLLKEDVARHLERPEPPSPAPRAAPAVAPLAAADREEQIVPMSPIRRRIAERLVHAQQTAALLTTFNEIDMGAVISLRHENQEAFQAKYKIKLGFMSFFVRAAVDALRLVPQVNAEVRDAHIVFRNYFDIGIAVGGGKGLVVPVLRHAERMSFAEIERAVADFAGRARDNRLGPAELEGGTFTISNGGIYGSLLSTPIVNPPQSAILGLHAITDRPVARGGQVVIRPMMYVALTYDHRIIDGREAVTFLKRVKDTIEDPMRMFLEV